MLSFSVHGYFFVNSTIVKANSTIELQKCKGHEKRDLIVVSKVDFQICQRLRELPISPVLSNLVDFVKKSVFFLKFESFFWKILKGRIMFSLKIEIFRKILKGHIIFSLKFESFSKQTSHCFLFAFINSLQLSVG